MYIFKKFKHNLLKTIIKTYFQLKNHNSLSSFYLTFGSGASETPSGQQPKVEASQPQPKLYSPSASVSPSGQQPKGEEEHTVEGQPS